MDQAAQQTKKDNKAVLIMALSTFLIVNFLFFIDEGYYDFRWMMDYGNWIVFFIYAGVTFFAQGILYMIIPKKMVRGKTTASIIAGSVLGLSLLMGVIFG